ncbi:MAG: hypothetical protein ACFFCS_29655 [Candidatus Hodarchaeota archaeon]
MYSRAGNRRLSHLSVTCQERVEVVLIMDGLPLACIHDWKKVVISIDTAKHS